jgi:hypothetical protein
MEKQHETNLQKIKNDWICAHELQKREQDIKIEQFHNELTSRHQSELIDKKENPKNYWRKQQMKPGT